MENVELWVVVGAALLGGLTPGPATLAIAGTAMRSGRPMALALALGVTGGATVWALASALGLGSVLVANQWLMEGLRYAGAAYLGWLAWRSARAALSDRALEPRDIAAASLGIAWVRGALIHLTNPKAMIFWGAIFTIGVRPGTTAEAMPGAIAAIVGVSLAINLVLVTGYALLFSSPVMTRGYLAARRWLEGCFAGFFGGAALWLVTSR